LFSLQIQAFSKEWLGAAGNRWEPPNGSHWQYIGNTILSQICVFKYPLFQGLSAESVNVGTPKHVLALLGSRFTNCSSSVFPVWVPRNRNLASKRPLRAALLLKLDEAPLQQNLHLVQKRASITLSPATTLRVSAASTLPTLSAVPSATSNPTTPTPTLSTTRWA